MYHPRLSASSAPDKSFAYIYSPRKEEQMSRDSSDFTQFALTGVSEQPSWNEKSLTCTFIEPCGTETTFSGVAVELDRPSERHRVTEMRSNLCLYQRAAFFLSLLGWVCSLVTAMLQQWLIMNSDLVQTETFSIGIWETCVAQDDGPVQCKGYDSFLGLPDDIKLTRILMCTSIVLGLLGLFFSLSGSASITCFSDNETTKERLAVSGGIFCLLAGTTTFAPVTYIAHMTVVKFWDNAIPSFVPRWEFGPALFVGWAGAFFLLLGSLLQITSQCCFQKSTGNIQLKPPIVKRASWYKTEYV
ncbi:putative claudin-24 isoform X1 [Scyliorhinus canicula]|uniref:putative claudin-24 isoform X1 n=2 Tax=Scyliorhinus canicula TaxID=7830 RepID=UPI0018F59B05|nr:putative claudin-24 isoform X1 [Scyliorhinus canicula]